MVATVIVCVTVWKPGAETVTVCVPLPRTYPEQGSLGSSGGTFWTPPPGVASTTVAGQTSAPAEEMTVK